LLLTICWDFISFTFRIRIKSTNDWRPSYWRPNSQHQNNANQNLQIRRGPNDHSVTQIGEDNQEEHDSRRTVLQKHNNNKYRPANSNSKGRTPWISKLQNTVNSFKENIKHKVTQLLPITSSSFSSLTDSSTITVDRSSVYNPNRQGILALTQINPLAAVFSSLVTTLSITSLAFTKEIVFGNTYLAGEDTSSSSSLLYKNPFVSAVYALCEILSSGLQRFFDIPTGGCGSGEIVTVNKERKG